MNRLVKLQVRNIFHNKLFYVCLGINVLLTVGFSFIAQFLSKDATGTQMMPGIITILADGVGLIGMVFITLFTTFDFSEGTTKNIIARGYTKVELLFSKYIASLIGIFTMEIILVVLGAILYAKNGVGFESYMTMAIVVHLIGIVAYTFFYVTTSFILEKTASAIIVNMFVPNLIMLGLGIADSNLKVHMSKYWIDSVASTFKENPTAGNMAFPVIMYLVYIAIFIILGIYFARNKDVK